MIDVRDEAYYTEQAHAHIMLARAFIVHAATPPCQTLSVIDPRGCATSQVPIKEQKLSARSSLHELRWLNF